MSGPRRVADLLKDVLRNAQTQAGRHELNKALSEALGSEQAEHCHVVGFRAGKLVVEVDSAPLYAELIGFKRETIRQAVNSRLKHPRVAELVFRMGGTGHV